MHPRQILTTGLAALVLAVLVLFLNPQLTPRAANGLLFTIVALMMAYRITYDNGKIRVVTRQTILVLVFSLLGGITAALVIIFVSSRSEERRVGNGGRAPGRRGHQQKKHIAL